MEVDGHIATLGEVYQNALDLISKLNSFDGGDRERQELAEVIQTRLKAYESSLFALDLQIEDVLDEDLKRRHLVSLDRLKENLRLARARFRKAQVQSKKNSEMSWAAQRAKLFARNEGAAGKGKERLKKTTEELVVSKSEEVTTALREMHRLAQAEALKSHLTVDELEYSSHSLRELEHKYGAYDVVLHGARRMVKHIQEADAADRRNMILSLTFLATVVAWIIWRRIVRRPVMLILWTIAKLLGIVKVVSKPFSPADTVNATNDLTVAATTAIIGAVVHAVTESVSIAATASYASETLFPIEPSIETDDVEESVLDTTATVIHDDL